MGSFPSFFIPPYYTAAAPGTDLVTVTGGGATGSVSIVTVDTPDEIHVVRETTTAPLNMLTVEPGETLELSAISGWKNIELTAQDTCYTWSVDPAVGTIDEDGTLTAGILKAEGPLTVAAGGMSTTIQVSVHGLPFVDVPVEQWYYDAVRYVYDSG